MPELPEIETVKLQLARVLVGQKSTKFEVLSTKVTRGNLDVIVGKKVEELERRGKVLLIKFGEHLKLGFHFKMTGQLIYEKFPISTNKYQSQINTNDRIVGGHPTEDFENPMPGKHTRVIFYFDRGTLFFNDQRMFGWIEINPKFVDNLGPEPFETTEDQFVDKMGKTKRPIKIAMMDQAIISGVGNIYANDALWEARINPRVASNQLTAEQLGVLLEKVKLVLREGIKYGGATYSDYVNAHGLGGHYQDHFRTYDRDGKKCLRDDGGIIVKFDLGGRGTYMCPKCQE